MRIVVGHANPDFDAYAATVAATKLFEGACGVFLGSQNANVRAFHNLHEEFLDFVDLKGLDLDAIDAVVMVDTRDPDRLGELGLVARREGVEVIVYDHHPPQEGDIEGADDRSMDVGATTSILVHEIKRRGIELTPLEASVMLLGVHEDTGSLVYPSATAYDADAAAYLMAQGADMEVLNQFLSRTLDEAQRDLLGQLTDSLEVWDVNGQQVAVGTAVAETYVDSASVLTHYVVEDMGYRVAVAVVSMPERLLVVARSRLAEVDVGAALARIGGGGHPQAASAGYRDKTIPEALELVRGALEAQVRAPLRAADVMSTTIRSVTPEQSMAHAGELMARWGHGGLPVIEDGRLVGLVTRKDVDKATRHKLAHAPVTGFMARDVVTASPDTLLSELERILATRGIGRVPVIESGAVVGMVTRKDVLRAEHGDAYLDARLPKAHPGATKRFIEGVDRLLPGHVREALHRLGEVAQRRGERAHVVGGFVRDMIIGRENLDVDIVVEGDGVAFAQAVGDDLGLRVTAHRRFGTAVIVFSKEFHVDVASARTEYYVRPGALPTVERSSLRQDLFRRDFTINAMAACIDPACFGAIADPYDGLGDLKAGTVRVLHALSFVDDPTRVLRAARFEARYGFAMDSSTERLAAEAVALGLLDEVSGARLREELYDIIDEPLAAATFERLDSLGVLGGLATDAPGSSATRVRAALEAMGALEPSMRKAASKRGVAVCALCGLASQASAERWLRHLRIGRAIAQAARSLTLRGAAILEVIDDERELRDSRLAHLLEELPAETIVVLWSMAAAPGRTRIERYLTELSHIKPSVSGADLIEMGATPGGEFAAILAQARDAKLDGRVKGRRDELDNLRRLAEKAGLIPAQKGTTE